MCNLAGQLQGRGLLQCNHTMACCRQWDIVIYWVGQLHLYWPT